MSKSASAYTDQAKQGSFYLLYLSPWIVILIFSLWHIFTQRHAHQLARANWNEDRTTLAAVFAGITTEYRGVLPQPASNTIQLGPPTTSSTFDIGEARESLVHLADDLHDLEGASDETSKQAFLKAVNDCIPPEPKTGLAELPRPYDQCLKLIRNQGR